MRISHKYKFIFISKPKCASSSIRHMLDEYSDIKSNDVYPFHHHVTAFELKTYFEKMGWNWEEYYSFCTLRNPWDMIVSWYHYAKPDKKGNYFYQPNVYNSNNLIDFENWIINKRKTFHKTHYCRKLSKHSLNIFTNDFSGITIKKYTEDNDGNRLVNKVIKVENLALGIPKVFRKLGLNTTSVPVMNTTNHENYKQYYSEKTYNIIAKEFESDINLGNYEF